MFITDSIDQLKEELRFKTNSDYLKTLTVLMTSASLFLFAVIIGSAKFITLTDLGFRVLEYHPIFVYISVFFSIFIGGMLVGWIFKNIMTILGGVGEFLEGLSVIAYTLLPLSIGTLVASTAAYLPVVGSLLSYVFIFLFISIAYSVLYRTTKEFFEVNMITAMIGISILLGSGVGAFYATFLASSGSMAEILNFVKP